MLTHPNGAIVRSGGHYYVFAGGKAFLAPTNELAALEKVDHARLLSDPSGTGAPGGASPRPGTLLSTKAAGGKATVYVAGNDGKLHGFASVRQLLADGYDPALIVTVPSLGGLSVGRTTGAMGKAANALATRADGAIVDSSGAFYVFAGGRAFGVPAGGLARLEKADKAKILSGKVGTAEKTASVADGVLISAPGAVYVSYQGDLYPFGTTVQLAADGYAGTAAVLVPGTDGLHVISPYAGS